MIFLSAIVRVRRSAHTGNRIGFYLSSVSMRGSFRQLPLFRLWKDRPVTDYLHYRAFIADLEANAEGDPNVRVIEYVGRIRVAQHGNRYDLQLLQAAWSFGAGNHRTAALKPRHRLFETCRYSGNADRRLS